MFGSVPLIRQTFGSCKLLRPVTLQLYEQTHSIITSRGFASKKVRRLQHTKKKIPKSPAAPKFTPTPPPLVPLFITPTSSPNAYVAICACEEYGIDPKSLFIPSEQMVPSFLDSEFHFCHPSKFPNQELPTYPIPEVALLGRSNVGKSSLMNAIMKQNLAKCSKTPGRTQTVNYYPMIPRRLCSDKKKPWEPYMALGFLVDLPGYGYAEAPDAAVEEWQTKTQDFLLARQEHGTLTRLFLLIDARRGPTQIDRNIMGWMDDAGIAYSIVITKADRVSKPQLVKYANEVCMRYHSQLYSEYGCQGPVVHVTSASDKIGIDEMQYTIDAEFTGYHSPPPEPETHRRVGEGYIRTSGDDYGGAHNGDDYDDENDDDDEYYYDDDDDDGDEGKEVDDDDDVEHTKYIGDDGKEDSHERHSDRWTHRSSESD